MKNTLVSVLILIAILIGCSNDSSDTADLKHPTPDNSSYPYLHTVEDTLYMSWISSADQGHALQYSKYAAGTWSSPQTIARDSTWFVNWADFPSIIADHDGPVAAHSLDLTETQPLAYDINIYSVDSSNKWSDAIVPHDDGTTTEHGFVSMIPWDSETFLAVWLDGRETDGRTSEEYYDLDYAMTLRGAFITDEGEIKESFLIDNAVCDCCPTSLVKTSDGAVVAYRNRTEDEIRDIAVSRFDGEKWSSPQIVHNDNWEIGACPVNGPQLAANGSSIALAWHTGADDQPMTKAAISMDGKEFGKPVVLNKSESLGRVDAAIKNGSAYISWMERDSDDRANLQLASFGLTDTSATTRNVDQISSSRGTGFPQMEIVGDEILFAWTNADSSDEPKVEMRQISLPF